jgi:hypothetical protein
MIGDRIAGGLVVECSQGIVMADILLTCPNCGKQTSISEYVSEASITCQACGKSIPVPERTRPANEGLKFRPASSESQIAPTWPSSTTSTGLPIAAVGQQAKMPASLKRDLRRVKLNRLMMALSWLVFILLAALMYWMRFQFHGLPGVPLETLKLGGLVAIGIAYLVIILLALQDNMFDGLLAIIIPLYPFYYVFLISDALFIRAIVAALLVGFGYDLILFLHVVWLHVYDGINSWISHV